MSDPQPVENPFDRIAIVPARTDWPDIFADLATGLRNTRQKRTTERLLFDTLSRI